MPNYEVNRQIRAVSTTYQKGKTQIPSEVRKSLGIEDGDKLLWIIDNGRWVIERA